MDRKDVQLKIFTVGQPNLESLSTHWTFQSLIRDVYYDMMAFFATEEGMREFEEWKKETKRDEKV